MLGLLLGLTEFLPSSSSAHLAVVPVLQNVLKRHCTTIFVIYRLVFRIVLLSHRWS